jgi:hypothetical protein
MQREFVVKLKKKWREIRRVYETAECRRGSKKGLRLRDGRRRKKEEEKKNKKKGWLFLL